GYGNDWGFVIASRDRIAPTEISEPFRKLFVFPAEVLQFRQHGAPASEGSDILLHYMFNDEELDTTSGAGWDSLGDDLLSYAVPEADAGLHLIPAEIRAALTEGDTLGIDEEKLFAHVVRIVPALRRFQTRRMIAEFVS